MRILLSSATILSHHLLIPVINTYLDKMCCLLESYPTAWQSPLLHHVPPTHPPTHPPTQWIAHPQFLAEFAENSEVSEVSDSPSSQRRSTYTSVGKEDQEELRRGSTASIQSRHLSVTAKVRRTTLGCWRAECVICGLRVLIYQFIYTVCNNYFCVLLRIVLGKGGNAL